MSNNVIQFPQKMSNEEVELLYIEKEMEEVSNKVRSLAIDLENANRYLKDLIEQHEVYKDAVDRGISLLHFEVDPEWED